MLKTLVKEVMFVISSLNACRLASKFLKRHTDTAGIYSKTEMSKAIVFECSQGYFQPEIGRKLEYTVSTAKTIGL